MISVSDEKIPKVIIEKIINTGKRLTPEAEKYLFNNIPKDLDFFLYYISKISDLFITKEHLIKIFEKLQEKEKISLEPDIKIIFQPNIQQMNDNMKSLISYFRNRYEVIGIDILKDYGIRDITNLSKLSPGEHYIVGLISHKHITRDQVFIEIEDTTAKRKIYASSRDTHLIRLLTSIPLDSVICAYIRMRPNRAPVLVDIFLPKIKPSPEHPEDDIYVMVLSDLHIGSNEFLYDEFYRLVDILNGKVDDYNLQSIIRRTIYIVIAGDIVDGVGVYPGQDKDLLITDPREQYREAYKILSKIDHKKRILITPGNHDITRKALPRPPINNNYAKEFYDDDRFIMLSDPAYISLNGVKLYIFHGDFLNDIYATIPGVTQQNVTNAMEILLRVRHIAPTYGMQTKIILSEKDQLIIPKDLNIFLAGHVHIFDAKHVNDNMLIVNSGTWQKQTEYQKEMGLNPTPGIAALINLKNLKTSLIKLID